MGIEYFFSGLMKNKQIKTSDGIIKGIDSQTTNNFIYIDFNSILYMLATRIENEINYNIYESIVNNKYDDTIKYDNELLESKLIEYVKESIINICTNINNPDDVNTLYIGIDGTPVMSKIFEQRYRRYKNYMIKSLIKNFTQIDEDKLSENRIKYNKYKITFDRTVFSPDGKIMKEVTNILSNNKFINELKQKCKHLENYDVSGPDVIGEGEKKIMEHIFENMKEGKYNIISPDADMIILSIIMKSRFLEKNINAEFSILRLNDTTGEKDYIDIDKICENIYDYVKIKEQWIEKYRILNDISTIFTFFGNDFIPKLECINTKTDITNLVDLYISVLTSENYLTYSETGKYKINQDILFKFINELAKKEDKYLKNIYLMKNYKNYNYLTKLFIPEYENTYIGLEEYINKYNKIHEYLDNIDIPTESVLEIAKKIGLNNKSFKNAFCKIEGGINEINDDMLDFEYIYLIKSMSQNIRKKKLEYTIKKLYLHENDESSEILNDFHIKNIKDKLIHPMMQIEQNDITEYCIERGIGKFKKILNTDRNIVKVKLERLKTGYKLKATYDADEKNDTDIMTKQYIEGIYWVFNYYFNNNNKEYNCKNISTWFYKFKKAPLLENIVKYINNNKINDDFDCIKSINEYITRSEQYLFITPKPRGYIKDEYKKLRDNEYYFPNIKELINRILERENNKLDYKYLHECYKNIIVNYELNEYLDFIKTNIENR